MFDYAQAPAFAKSKLCIPILLASIYPMSEAALKEHSNANLLELLLRQGAEKTFLKWIKTHAQEIRELFIKHYGYSWIHYISGQESKHTSAEVIAALIEIAPHKEETIMTAAQYLRQEGRQEGMQQEKLHIAKNMLYKLHLDAKAISEATGLSQAELIQLQEEGKNID